jgi:hypothetical protein
LPKNTDPTVSLFSHNQADKARIALRR